MGNSQSQSDMYSDAASFGRFYTTIGLVFASIVSLIMLAVGAYLLLKKNNHTDLVGATITDVSCNSAFIDTNSQVCYLTLKYNYKGNNYTVTNFNYTYNPTTYYNRNPNNMIGTNLAVYVNPENPTDVSLDSKTTDVRTGYVLIGLAVLIVLIALFQWWLTRKSKFFAAAEGAGAGVGFVRRSFFY